MVKFSQESFDINPNRRTVEEWNKYFEDRDYRELRAHPTPEGGIELIPSVIEFNSNEYHLWKTQQYRRETLYKLIAEMDQNEFDDLEAGHIKPNAFLPSEDIKGRRYYDGYLRSAGNFLDFLADAEEQEEVAYWEAREAQRLEENAASDGEVVIQ